MIIIVLDPWQPSGATFSLKQKEQTMTKKPTLDDLLESDLSLEDIDDILDELEENNDQRRRTRTRMGLSF